MQKRILIISYFFAPQNLIGAIRPTKLAKYLARMGHDVTVLCGLGLDGQTDPTLQRDLQELPNVHLIQEWNPVRSYKIKKAAAPQPAPAAAPAADEPAAHPGAVKKLIGNGIDAAYRWMVWQAEESFRRRAIREFYRMNQTFDVVFSSYAPVAVHDIACVVKRSGRAKRWIADFRDEIGLPFAWQEGRKKATLQMLRKHADIICGVSDGIMEVMGLQDQSRVLHNGFDREDLPASAAADSHSTFRLAYCGLFNMGRKGVPDRDITPVLRALCTLMNEGLIRRDEIELIYAGSEGAVMRQYAASCGLEDRLTDHGQVPRAQSIALQRSADALLLASWHSPAQRGILTGKLFEYMMMDKPVLCCMAGDLPGSPIKTVLEETGIGVCCEEAGGSADEAALLAYVRKLVELWRAGQPLLTGCNQAAVDAYAYPGLARKLDSWINE